MVGNSLLASLSAASNSPSTALRRRLSRSRASMAPGASSPRVFSFLRQPVRQVDGQGCHEVLRINGFDRGQEPSATCCLTVPATALRVCNARCKGRSFGVSGRSCASAKMVHPRPVVVQHLGGVMARSGTFLARTARLVSREIIGRGWFFSDLDLPRYGQLVLRPSLRSCASGRSLGPPCVRPRRVLPPRGATVGDSSWTGHGWRVMRCGEASRSE